MSINGDVTFIFEKLPQGRHIEFTIDMLINTGTPPTILFPSTVLNPPTLPTLTNGLKVVLNFIGVIDDVGTRYTFIGGTTSGAASGANTALSNLDATTLINTSLVSDTNNTDDLGSASIKWRDVFINRNIRFGAGGQLLPTEPTIWVDASGEMIHNVASGDSFFQTVNGVVITQTKLDSFEVRTVTQDGPDLILNNDDQSPMDDDDVAQIFFKGNTDTLNTANFAAITVEQNDVSDLAKQGSFKISCQHDNSLLDVISYEGSTGIFRFSTAVDSVIRSNQNGIVDLGASAQYWNDVFSETYTLRGSGGNISGSARTIYATSATMFFNMPTGDHFTWNINNLSLLSLKDGSGAPIFENPNGGTFLFHDFNPNEILSLSENLIRWTNNTNANLPAFQIKHLGGTAANGRQIGEIVSISKTSTGAETDFAQIEFFQDIITNGNESGSIVFQIREAGAQIDVLTIDGTRLTLLDDIDISFGTTNGGKIGTNTSQKIGFWGVTPVTQGPAYTVTNLTPDRTYDANATTVAELADVLGTLLSDLKTQGLYG